MWGCNNRKMDLGVSELSPQLEQPGKRSLPGCKIQEDQLIEPPQTLYL